jgi:hypothetical protein
MTKTVDTVKGTSKREKIKLHDPGFLDPVWYGMLWLVMVHNMVSCCSMGRYGMGP